jgi:hypothetical protein
MRITPEKTPASLRCRASLPMAAALLLATALQGCAVSSRTVTPISRVVEISRESASPELALSRLRESRTTYALRGSDFAKLDRLGVPAAVLDHLQQSFVNDIDLLTRYWVLGESLGGCSACYPQPVNLAALDAGSNGMASATDLGRYYNYARPPGVPDWVPASPNTFNAPRLTVGEVAAAARQNVPTEELVRRVENSYLDGLIATGGFKGVSTHLEAGLRGSELAALGREGVPEPVLDAIQAKFLAQWIEFARIRYQSWGKGGPEP